MAVSVRFATIAIILTFFLFRCVSPYAYRLVVVAFLNIQLKYSLISNWNCVFDEIQSELLMPSRLPLLLLFFKKNSVHAIHMDIAVLLFHFFYLIRFFCINENKTKKNLDPTYDKFQTEVSRVHPQ